MKPSVLVLGHVPRIATPLARSMQRNGVATDVATFTAAEPRAVSRAVRQFFRVSDPDASGERFLSTMREVVKRGGHKLLVPGNDVALTAIQEYYAGLSEFIRVACPGPAVLERVLNKAITLDVGRSCGLRVPQTRIVNDPLAVAEAARHLGFPFVLKPLRKMRTESFKVRTIYNEQDFDQKVTQLTAASFPLLAQEYCEGSGVGVELFLRDGSAIATFQHRRIKELPYTGGVSVLAIAERPNPELVGSSALLLRELEWEGPAMVEFRLSSGGSAVLMEVNGRYWGTISLPIMCGVDFPNYQWKLFCGEAPTVSADWTARRWRWTAGYMRRLRQLIGAATRPGPARTQLLTDLRQITTDFGLNTADAIWLLQDPAPAASELWEAVRELFAAGAKTTVKVKGAPSSKEEVPSSPTKRTPENSEHIANS